MTPVNFIGHKDVVGRVTHRHRWTPRCHLLAAAAASLVIPRPQEKGFDFRRWRRRLRLKGLFVRRSLFTHLSGPEEQREVGDGGGEEIEAEIEEKDEKGHSVLPA